MSNDLWNTWSGIHNSPDQQKRIASAKKPACTPVSLNPEACTGTFKGSSGTHTTALNHCSCVDFNRRRLPCKHMYRLAMELGAFQTDFESDKTAIVEPKHSVHRERLVDTIKAIETLTADQQLLLLEIVRSVNSKSPTICCKSTLDLQVLLDCNLIETVPDFKTCLAKYKKPELIVLATSFGLEPDKKLSKPELINYILENASRELETCVLAYTVVQTCEHIRRRQVHMYLHRKWDSESYFDGDDLQATPLLKTELPDDAVTELLIQYGYYTPLDN